MRREGLRRGLIRGLTRGLILGLDEPELEDVEG